MTFAQALAAQFKTWDESEEFWLMEEFWQTLATTGIRTVGDYTVKVLRYEGGPEGDRDGDDYEFALDVDGKIYVAHVAYDSYEFSGNDYSLFEAEPFEFTETRYKKVARAR